MSDWDWGIIAPIVLLIVVIIVGVGCEYITNAVICTRVSETMQVDSQYKLLGGCFIEVENERWIPLDSYYWKDE